MNFLRRKTRDHKRTSAKRGFTLMEVMFSVMILGVGLIAAAALFPVAGNMQRATIDVITARQLAVSATAMVEQIKFDDTGWNTDGNLYPVVPLNGTPSTTTNAKNFRLADRCLPSGDVNGDSAIDALDIQQATMYWEPYYRWDTAAARWQVFLVIFRRTDDATAAIDANGSQIQNFLINPAGTPAVGDQNTGEHVLTDKGLAQIVIDTSNPIDGWVGRTTRSDPTLGATINMEVMQIVALTGVTR